MHSRHNEVRLVIGSIQPPFFTLTATVGQVLLLHLLLYGRGVSGPGVAWVSRPSSVLRVLQYKSPVTCHSIHFPPCSSCPLSDEACEMARTCVICEYIRLSAFALMLLTARLL